MILVKDHHRITKQAVGAATGKRIPSARGPGHGGGGRDEHAGIENGLWPGAGFSCDFWSGMELRPRTREKFQEGTLGGRIWGVSGIAAGAVLDFGSFHEIRS